MACRIWVRRIYPYRRKGDRGSIYVADYFAGAASEENRRFVEAYRKKYNRTPDNGVALGYTAVKIAASALRNAGANPTRDAVHDHLFKIKDFPSFSAAARSTSIAIAARVMKA